MVLYHQADEVKYGFYLYFSAQQTNLNVSNTFFSVFHWNVFYMFLIFVCWCFKSNRTNNNNSNKNNHPKKSIIILWKICNLQQQN